ncbi:MAG TPA: hypothetical protein VEQ66_00190 [Propionibacteriaceae bacterium]|nr:hypothetical protein [Propionibacteriaceae bacterium]
MSDSSARMDRSKQQALEVYAAADSETRQVVGKELDRVDALENRELDLHLRGLNYTILVTLAFLAACVFLIATGHGVEGTVLGVIFIVALMAIFVMGRR